MSHPSAPHDPAATQMTAPRPHALDGCSAEAAAPDQAQIPQQTQLPVSVNIHTASPGIALKSTAEA